MCDRSTAFDDKRRWSTTLLVSLLIAVAGLGAMRSAVAEASHAHQPASPEHPVVYAHEPVKGLAVLESRTLQVPPVLRRAPLAHEQADKDPHGLVSPGDAHRLRPPSSYEGDVRTAPSVGRYDVLHVYRL